MPNFRLLGWRLCYIKCRVAIASCPKSAKCKAYIIVFLVTRELVWPRPLYFLNKPKKKGLTSYTLTQCPRLRIPELHMVIVYTHTLNFAMTSWIISFQKWDHHHQVISVEYFRQKKERKNRKWCSQCLQVLGPNLLSESKITLTALCSSCHSFK